MQPTGLIGVIFLLCGFDNAHAFLFCGFIIVLSMCIFYCASFYGVVWMWKINQMNHDHMIYPDKRYTAVPGRSNGTV